MLISHIIPIVPMEKSNVCPHCGEDDQSLGSSEMGKNGMCEVSCSSCRKTYLYIDMEFAKEYAENIENPPKRFSVEHHWATVVNAPDMETAFDMATLQFLEDYDLKAFGLDLKESMRAKEI